MDSSCSRHMTRNKKWFSILTPLSHKEYVTFGDDKKGKVLGTGVIKVNDCFTLNDVTLVDRLRYNLLSISQLCDADLSLLFHNSDSHVLDSSGKRVYGISRIGNVFQADFSSAQSSLRCLISQSSSELWKWHRRLGPLSFDLLCRLNGLGLLRGLPLLKFENDLVCAPCRHGKMIATSHSLVNTMMTEYPEQLLHMDTIGPSRVRSIGGKWYVLVIIDDYSRYSWVFFLESKDEVFEHFRSMVLRLNNEHPTCLKVIRSDNGTEFRNASFDEFCLEHGIDQQFFAPRIPQQNRVVERKNRTLVEMARMMFDDHRTPRCFWADAISTACYISNQIFLLSILHLTPFQLRFGRKPSISHFRPFRCKCFVLKCGNLDKFESRSFDGILLGYTSHGISYRVYNFETNTVVESCDVTFDETAPCPHCVFECAGEREMEESIFIDEGLQGVDGDEDEPLLPSTSSPELVPASTLEAEAPQATTPSTTAVEASRVEGGIISKPGAPSHIQKVHPPQQIICNLNERVTRSSRSAHLSCFLNTLFVALFEP
jgi:transposase InsO family protein